MPPLPAEEIIGWVGDCERSVLADRVGIDLEVEIHTNKLEECIIDCDESDFDRHLEVLEPTKLTQQVSDLVVNLRRMLDDQADAQEEGNDRSGLPALRVEPAGVAAESAA